MIPRHFLIPLLRRSVGNLAVTLGREFQDSTVNLTAGQVDGESRSAFDAFGFESWQFLRTTTAEGPIASRTWIRDGKYVPLEQLSKRMFDVPIAGAIFQTKPTALAPFVAGVQQDYTIDCTFKRGEILLAPGPDHAAILAWRVLSMARFRYRERSTIDRAAVVSTRR